MLKVMTVMLNDSLAATLAKGHNYKRSLAGADLDDDGNLITQMDHSINSTTNSVENVISDIVNAIPWQIYVILGVIFLAWIAYLILRNGMLGMGYSNVKIEPDEADNIYDIDFDHETASALSLGNYAQLVRQVYLRTLHTLDQEGRIVWRIYKTPTQFASEVGTAEFRKMTRQFLRVRYGKFPADKTLYDQMLAWQHQVLKGGAS